MHTECGVHFTDDIDMAQCYTKNAQRCWFIPPRLLKIYNSGCKQKIICYLINRGQERHRSFPMMHLGASLETVITYVPISYPREFFSPKSSLGIGLFCYLSPGHPTTVFLISAPPPQPGLIISEFNANPNYPLPPSPYGIWKFDFLSHFLPIRLSLD